MLKAAQFTIATIWNQTRVSSMDDWIKKMWILFAMEYYSVILKIAILSLQQNVCN